MAPRQEERGVPILADDGLVLEGLFVAGGAGDPGGAVIAPPHPRYGGSMDSPVVSELAFACARAGLASLRFNWRGVGGSAGRPSGDAGDADADTRAALRHLGETVAGPLVACGYSFGAGSAVRVARGEPRVRGLLLVAPPPSLLDADTLLAFPGRVLLLAGERDTLAPPRRLSALATQLRSGRFEAIPDADHFFGAGLATLGRLALGWLGGEERGRS